MEASKMTKLNNKLEIVMVRGMDPFLLKKYDVTKHEKFKYTGDFDQKNNNYDIAAHFNNNADTNVGIDSHVADIQAKVSGVEEKEIINGILTFKMATWMSDSLYNDLHGGDEIRKAARKTLEANDAAKENKNAENKKNNRAFGTVTGVKPKNNKPKQAKAPVVGMPTMDVEENVRTWDEDDEEE
jgi:hypothetical protein